MKWLHQCFRKKPIQIHCPGFQMPFWYNILISPHSSVHISMLHCYPTALPSPWPNTCSSSIQEESSLPNPILFPFLPNPILVFHFSTEWPQRNVPDSPKLRGRPSRWSTVSAPKRHHSACFLWDHVFWFILVSPALVPATPKASGSQPS